MTFLRNNWGILLFLIIGSFLRLWQLDLASYQIDELATMEMWQADRTAGAVFEHALRDLHWNHRMVLLPLLNMLIMKHGSYTSPLPPEWMARLPHAIMGILVLPIFWALGRAYGGRGTAWWTMLLASFSVFAVYYAREAYDYNAVIFFSAGVVWTGVELFHQRSDERAASWGHVLGFVFFSTGLLMAHLSGLLFLGCWIGMIAIGVVARWRSALLKRPREIGFWILVCLPCFLFFMPFLLRLFGGYTNMDSSPVVRQFSMSVIPVVIGRLGWGESLVPLALFVGALGLGTLRAVRARGAWAAPVSYGWLLIGAAVVYFAAQSWSLRVARMEVRYYSPLFPLLVVIAASGLDALTVWAAGRSARMTPAVTRTALCVPLLAWLLPSLAMVCELHTRGFNYKDTAKWIMERLPENGVYAFYNVYELRGVPRTYPTPGRDGTSVASWSSQQDFDRANPPERARSLFTRFPQIVFMEISPEDLLSPTPVTPPIDRDGLFMRREWIGDPACDRLFEWRTHPMGEVQWNTKFMHRTLVSYNLPEDLPALAKKRGRTFYHGFGPGWRYVNDQGYNHWMSVRDSAQLFVGNVSTQALTASLHLRMLAPPPGCRLHVFSPQGAHLAAYDLNAQGLSEARITGQLLPPGESAYRVNVTPLSSGAATPPALLYSIEVELDSKGVPGSI